MTMMKNIRKSKTYSHKQLIKRCPSEIESLIINYLDKTTRYCSDCDKITPTEDWLGKDNVFDYCPECFGICCNDLCKKITEVDELTENDNCNDDSGCYCEDCSPDFMFFCEGCSENHCLGDGVVHNTGCYCDGATECVDCGSKYCFDCKCEDGIFSCNDCGDYSCCRRFIKTNDEMGEYCLICEECILYIKPNNYKPTKRCC